jgi:hypothetical protein
MPLPRIRRSLALAGALTLALTGAASGAAKTTKAAKVAKAATKAAAVAPTTFPSVKVIDLSSSKSFDLASLNVTTKPQLVWFWAPT